MADTVLDVQGIVAGYTEEIDILHGVSIRVDDGELVAIIGPNGAGKSTLIKAVFGILTPRSGRIVFLGEDITGLPPQAIAARGLCYVPQIDNVFTSLTVEENLELGAWLRPEGMDDALEVVFDLFPILQGRRRSKVGHLSGGQRQMVAIGRSLMLDPDLLLLDEPSAGLAPSLVDDVFQSILRVREETGTPIVLVEQDAKRALGAADRGYVLDTGENRFEGTGPELLEDPQVGRLYLGG